MTIGLGKKAHIGRSAVPHEVCLASPRSQMYAFCPQTFSFIQKNSLYSKLASLLTTKFAVQNGEKELLHFLHLAKRKLFD